MTTITTGNRTIVKSELIFEDECKHLTVYWISV